MTDNRSGPAADRAFVVDLGAGEATGGDAGFAACRIGGVEITSARFRAGELPSRAEPNLSPPATRAVHVTLERGVLDSDQLSGWLGADRTRVRTVRVALQSADRRTTLATWVLDDARIIRFVGRPIGTDGTGVEVDELTLVCGGVALDADA